MTRKRGRGGWTLGALAALAVAVAIALRGGFPGSERPRRPAAIAPETPRPAAPGATRTCVRVVDGDTILLDGDERVRLIGVDTPELHRPNTPVQFYAREASAFTRRLVEHRRVRLEFDRTHPSDGYPRRDKYGRTLAYVYLGDGTFVNLEIVRRGYGFAYTRFPFRYLDEFRAAERAARESGAGLWAEPDSIGRPA
jgi:micrococcal nuclease